MRQVIFPLVYWDLIRIHANKHDLDPYVMAALINQESTFDPDIRSSANAWGLMQIVPPTGRRLARTLGIRRFTTAGLTNPQTNIRMGMLYFSQLVRQFGGTYYALASYNAGESRVVTSRSPKPRITSSGSSGLPKTTGCCTAAMEGDRSHRWWQRSSCQLPTETPRSRITSSSCPTPARASMG
jgi:soluble lytic murein transglycosylase